MMNGFEHFGNIDENGHMGFVCRERKSGVLPITMFFLIDPSLIDPNYRVYAIINLISTALSVLTVVSFHAGTKQKPV
ncbi:MAG: hypothetical protein Q6364_02915 [Candidatus Hermodarchaeota archaeon]|nr:hypothetical protein [Candidatus Hermodarchaeota archaeon]